jgi:chitinase
VAVGFVLNAVKLFIGLPGAIAAAAPRQMASASAIERVMVRARGARPFLMGLHLYT